MTIAPKQTQEGRDGSTLAYKFEGSSLRQKLKASSLFVFSGCLMIPMKTLDQSLWATKRWWFSVWLEVKFVHLLKSSFYFIDSFENAALKKATEKLRTVIANYCLGMISFVLNIMVVDF